jgi:hypothetical protein
MTTEQLTQQIKTGLKKSEIIFWHFVLSNDNSMTHVNNAIIDRFGRDGLANIKKAAEKLAN